MVAAGLTISRTTYDGFDHIAQSEKMNDAGVLESTTYKYDPLDRTASKTAVARRLTTPTGFQPWRAGSFRFSDPELVANVTDVVGLHLDPPRNAIVLSVDEKSQIQAWTGPSPCCRPNRI